MTDLYQPRVIVGYMLRSSQNESGTRFEPRVDVAWNSRKPFDP